MAPRKVSEWTTEVLDVPNRSIGTLPDNVVAWKPLLSENLTYLATKPKMTKNVISPVFSI